LIPPFFFPAGGRLDVIDGGARRASFYPPIFSFPFLRCAQGKLEGCPNFPGFFFFAARSDTAGSASVTREESGADVE